MLIIGLDYHPSFQQIAFIQVAAKGSFPVADDSPTSRAILGVSECNGLWVLKKSLP